MRVITLQFEAHWHQVGQSLQKLTTQFSTLFSTDNANPDRCVLVVLPEMFASGFSMEPEKFSESETGTVTTTLSKLAHDYQVQILAGVVQHDHYGDYYNRALWFDEFGEQKVCYSKQKLFRYANEHHFYRPGKSFASTVLTGKLRCAVFICYDLRFPELFRQVAKTVQMVVVIANWPQSREDHWCSLLKARAIENQLYVLGVNRIGEDGNELLYNGHSMLFGPSGELIMDAAQLPSFEVALDSNQMLTKVSQVRELFPVLEDM